MPMEKLDNEETWPVAHIIASADIVADSLLITSGLSGFHMRPLVALASLLKGFENEYSIKLAMRIGDDIHPIESMSIIKLTLSALVRWKQFTLQGVDTKLTEDQLQELQKRMLKLEEIGKLVPRALSRILKDSPV